MERNENSLAVCHGHPASPGSVFTVDVPLLERIPSLAPRPSYDPGTRELWIDDVYIGSRGRGFWC